MIELTCSVEENVSATHRLVQVSVVVIPFLVLLLSLAASVRSIIFLRINFLLQKCGAF